MAGLKVSRSPPMGLKGLVWMVLGVHRTSRPPVAACSLVGVNVPGGACGRESGILLSFANGGALQVRRVSQRRERVAIMHTMSESRSPRELVLMRSDCGEGGLSHNEAGIIEPEAVSRRPTCCSTPL